MSWKECEYLVTTYGGLFSSTRYSCSKKEEIYGSRRCEVSREEYDKYCSYWKDAKAKCPYYNKTKGLFGW